MDLYFSQQKANDKECLVIDNALVNHLNNKITDNSSNNPKIKANDRVFLGNIKEQKFMRSLLLPVFHELQKEIGWISEGALNYLGEKLNIPPAEAYGVVTFYSLLATERRSKVVVHVCTDIACIKFSEKTCDYLNKKLGNFETIEPDNPVAWMPSPCLGICEKAPAVYMQVTGADDVVMAPANLVELKDIIMRLNDGKRALHSINKVGYSKPQLQLEYEEDSSQLLKRIGKANPKEISDYCSYGGYKALKKAIDLGPEKVLKELHLSNLVGRGGAAFPTAIKWEAVHKSEILPHYVVCNADESEPGTFKDRILMEHDPFAVIESMTIAGITTGSRTGYIYIRGEYPQATRAIENALIKAKSFGYLGSNILNSGCLLYTSPSPRD